MTRTGGIVWALWLAGAAMACGGDDDDAAVDAGSRADAASSDAAAGEDAAVCAQGAACADNPNSDCATGRIECDGAVPSCVDDEPVADGTGCDDGLCGGGACRPSVIVDAEVDLSSDALVSGRTCAEAPQHAVASLSATSATLAATPADGCFAPGDEVLLINLQGATGDVVEFAAAKTRSYGAATGSDAGIGTGAGDQKVALIRVPHYGALDIASTGVLSTAAWDGATGGVVAARAETITIDGAVSAEGIGYRAGRWSRDAACSTNVATEAGESISGPAVAGTARNAGGAGGISAATSSYLGNTPVSSTSGHATTGVLGTNEGVRTLGEPGAAYGIGDGTRLTMGSGSSGNLTCVVGEPEPILVDGGPAAAGIVVLLGGDVAVGATGTVSATAPDAGRDTASSGGYVYIEGADVALGEARVTARGAVARGGSTATADVALDASAGYVAVKATGALSGVTDPVATVVTP